MATSAIYDELFHVENNVILTTKNSVTVQQTFNYLSLNLDKFRVGSEFVVICGVHGSEEGKLMEGDEIFQGDYKTMFRWFNSQMHYEDFSPQIAQPFQLIEERNYQMGRVVNVTSKLDETNDEKYVLTDQSRESIKNEFERILNTDTPTVLILASCWSFRSELSNLLRSTGLYSALIASEERGEITAGKLFRLDEEQQSVLKMISNDESIKDSIFGGKDLKIYLIYRIFYVYENE